MKIKNVRLVAFKRFTDLTITDIPETTRLVVLVGPNGSGKSSLFDGFNVLSSTLKGGLTAVPDYHIKAGLTGDLYESIASNKVNVTFHDHVRQPYWGSSEQEETMFYIRTGYRYEPDFKVNSIAQQGSIVKEPGQPQFLMSLDTRVSKNYVRLVSQTVADIYDSSQGDAITKKEIRERIIGGIGDAFNRVLPSVKFIGLGNPFANGSFFFEKGESKNWPYKNLSAGEKAAFDLVLDFVIKSSVYTNTVYCIDEPEVHINPNAQSALLNELYNSLPDQSQLWIATHSASMMRKARELEEANPGTVVFLDFGNQDFDHPVVMRPANTNRSFWQRNFSIAMGELAELVAPTRIFFCEGDPNGRKKKEFDAKCYSAIFAGEFPDAVFLSVGSSNEVKEKANLLSGVFSQFLKGAQTTFIVDRDDCTEDERLTILQEGNKILEKRHLEVYMLDDEILERFCVAQGKAEVWPALKAAKQQLLLSSQERGNPSDDWKSIGESIRTTAKSLLGITQIGSNADAFILGYLVPQVTPDTNIYQRLKREIFSPSPVVI